MAGKVLSAPGAGVFESPAKYKGVLKGLPGCRRGAGWNGGRRAWRWGDSEGGVGGGQSWRRQVRNVGSFVHLSP